MAVAPPLNPPRFGERLCAELSYVKRASAAKQAAYWNAILAEDPVLGPSSGMIVGVAHVKDNDCRYPLIWVPSAPTGAPAF